MNCRPYWEVYHRTTFAHGNDEYISVHCQYETEFDKGSDEASNPYFGGRQSSW